MSRFSLTEDVAALDELLLKGDAWPTTRPVMTMVLVLAEQPAPGRLEAAFVRAAAEVPRMRQRVVRSVLAAGRASWVADEDLDLDYHLRRIGAPGDGSFEAALDWASAGATAPFDAARPLWDATIVERLVDRRTLVVIRAHHAIADGVRAIQMMAALLDLEPHPPSPDAAQDDGRTELSPSTSQIVRAFQRVWVINPQTASDRSRSAFEASLHPFRMLVKSTAYVRSALRTMDRGDAHPSPLLSERGSSRRFATVALSLEDLKVIATKNAVTVNDVYLTGLLGGMGRYHEAFELPRCDVPIALPIDVAGADHHEAGNHIGAAILPGPASMADPVERLRAVHDLVVSRREEPGLRAMDHLAPTLGQLPARVAIAALGVHARRVDLQASNLVGPSFPLFLAGEKVEQMNAFGPLPGVPVMAVLVSYDGTCTIGFTLDPSAITDAPLFVECVRDSFDELIQIG